MCANVILVSVSFVFVVGSKSLDESSLVLRAWFRGRLDVLAPSTATTTNVLKTLKTEHVQAELEVVKKARLKLQQAVEPLKMTMDIECVKRAEIL